MLTDQANYGWWPIQMGMYVWWWISNYTFLKEVVRSVLWCFNALQYTFRVPQRSRDALGKKTLWQGCRYSNVLPRIFRPLSPVVNLSDSCPWGHKQRKCSARKLPNLKKSILKCNAVRLSGWWVYRKFSINLPSNMKDLEVKHGGLEKNHTTEHLRKPPLNQRQQIKMQDV